MNDDTMVMRERPSENENMLVAAYTPDELLRLAKSHDAEERKTAASYGGHDVLALVINDEEPAVKETALKSLFSDLPNEYKVLSCSIAEKQGDEKEAIYCEIEPKEKQGEAKIGFWVDVFANDRVAVYNDEAFLDKDGNFTNIPIPEQMIKCITESLQKSGAEICHILTDAERLKENQCASLGKNKHDTPER